ncbi:MAG: 7-carboxy-7-deazaguanine synthase [Pseudomonadota bacterium]
MSYSVKEIFHTLQGEGAQAGRPAVFCRFAGCNLWSGREEDRLSAICQFCDTDFVGTDGVNGGRFADAQRLADAIDEQWPETESLHKYVVFTGGEPLLQLDVPLISAMHTHGFEVAIETNGTLPIPKGIDWVCVSPKQGATLIVERGNEIKVVVPQTGQDLAAFEQMHFQHYFLQPMDGPDKQHNTELAISICKQRPRWRLSVQMHKLLQLP